MSTTCAEWFIIHSNELPYTTEVKKTRAVSVKQGSGETELTTNTF